MRIVHFSDWHGKLQFLPPADIYVCTGDMLPNFPIVERGSIWYEISPTNERQRQNSWMKHADNQLRERLASPEAPIICVRGNHDFVPIAPLFAGCDVTELVDNEVHEICGIRFTGHRGIPYIVGTWNDEVPRPDLHDRMCQMPKADVYVTHYPPGGILDDDAGWPGRRTHYGLSGMGDRLLWLTSPDQEAFEADAPVLALHLFGHIHEYGGRMEQYANVLFSNAATSINTIDYDTRRR